MRDDDKKNPAIENATPTTAIPSASATEKTPATPPSVPSHAAAAAAPGGGTSTKKRVLTAAFNMAVGAGVSYAAKSLVFSAACTVGATALVTTAAATATAGLATGLVKIGIDNGGNYFEAFNKKNRKANLKRLAFHTGFTMLGGFLFGAACEYGQGMLSKVFNFFTGGAETAAIMPVVIEQTAATPVQVLTETPAAITVQPLTGLDKVADIVAHDGDISQKGLNTLTRAQNGNPQALKDLGFFLFNGREGFPIDRPLAVDMFHRANDLGHGGAGVDLAYSEYHGLGGIPKNHGGGVTKMLESLDQMNAAGQAGTPENNRGWNLLFAWTGPLPEAGPAVTAPMALPEITPAVAPPATPFVSTTPHGPVPADFAAETPAVVTTPASPQPPASSEMPPYMPRLPTEGESCASIVVPGEGISFHCKMGQHAAILSEGDRVRIMLKPGR